MATPTLRFQVFRGDALVAEPSFQEASVSIGRAAHALLRVEDDALGPLHAVLNVEDDGGVTLLDLGTPTGTVVNGERVSNARIAPGTALQLGPVRIVVSWEEAEKTTPTMDVRPDAAPAAAPVIEAAPAPAIEAAPATAPAAEAAPAPVFAAEEEDDEDEPAEDVMELIMRSGTGASAAGLDLKAPKVLEVNQVWSNMLLDTRHFGRGGKVTIGSSVGYKWSLLGVPVGWVPENLASALRVSPPIWSEVDNQWRSSFYCSNDQLPNGADHDLFVSEGGAYVARLDAKWDGFVDVGAQRFTFAEAVAAGKARQAGAFLEIPITEDTRVAVDVGGVIFVGHLVAAGARVVANLKDELDYPFLAVTSLFLFVGLLFGAVIASAPPPAASEIVEVDDRFVELMIQKPEEPEPEPEPELDGKKDANKDAGEGAKAKGEEGKVGKEDGNLKQAMGNKREFNQQAYDKQVAENAGVLGALGESGGAAGMFGGAAGLDPNLAGAIGGLVGAKGVQIGSGGLGSRGSGLGGGGTAEGLGGMGTKGTGQGSSGYGSGGGSFGNKGEGRVSAVSGDPVILGALDRSLIDEVIKRKMSQIRYCYQRELQKDPNLSGKVTIKFTIAKDGSVSAADVKSTTLNNPAAESCIKQRFFGMVFPEPKGGGIVVVSYPFIFSPG